MQTWTIKGKTYNRHQLDELKRQGLDPRKDEIIMKFLSGNDVPEVAEEVVVEIEVPVETAKPKVEPAAPVEVAEPVVETPKAEAVAEDAPAEAEEVAPEVTPSTETEEEEFERLKSENAWLSKDKKDRYNELKAKFAA